jgi:hypothetical protein
MELMQLNYDLSTLECFINLMEQKNSNGILFFNAYEPRFFDWKNAIELQLGDLKLKAELFPLDWVSNTFMVLKNSKVLYFISDTRYKYPSDIYLHGPYVVGKLKAPIPSEILDNDCENHLKKLVSEVAPKETLQTIYIRQVFVPIKPVEKTEEVQKPKEIVKPTLKIIELQIGDELDEKSKYVAPKTKKRKNPENRDARCSICLRKGHKRDECQHFNT